MSRAAALGLAACLAAGCAAGEGALFVTVEAAGPLRGVQLEVTAQHGGKTSTPVRLPAGAARVDLPPAQTFQLRFPSHLRGEVTVEVKAVDGDRVLARGEAKGTLAPSREAAVTVVLPAPVGPDGGADGAVDGGAGGDAAGVACGGGACGRGLRCCGAVAQGPAGGACAFACPDGGLSFGCDGPEDCGGRPYCCMTYDNEVVSGACQPVTATADCTDTCAPVVTTMCPGRGTVRRCQVAGDCQDPTWRHCCELAGVRFCVDDALRPAASRCF